MKYILLLLIPLLLLTSCTLTQRRYTSGYSVDWKHKAPKTIVNKEPGPAIVHTNIVRPIATKELATIATPAVKYTFPTLSKKESNFQIKSTASNHVIPTSKQSISTANNAIKPPTKNQPQFYTGDEEVDDYARKSLLHGILSLGIPAAAFLIMLGIVLSIGGTLTAPVGYAVAIFAVGCAIGLVYSVSAIINGFHAIKEINAQPDTYTGKGEAITGMILAAILPIGLIVAYFLAKYLN